MQYIASKTLVHRDLAARNILLCGPNTAKISDFGLCCKCDETFTYHASLSKKLPIKWLAIEALKDHIFSEKSDVWSFGILLYEVYTFGKVPYTTMNHDEVLKFLQEGKRLDCPEGMPTELYDLAMQCWEESSQNRPNFTELEQKLHTLIENETESYGYLLS
uniref:Protein kinase domain-containing protein n=1 Tax=Acrobeloides nanus TaxID=290746 RepID=A0A914EQQ5_9BILA